MTARVQAPAHASQALAQIALGLGLARLVQLFAGVTQLQRRIRRGAFGGGQRDRVRGPLQLRQQRPLAGCGRAQECEQKRRQYMDFSPRWCHNFGRNQGGMTSLFCGPGTIVATRRRPVPRRDSSINDGDSRPVSREAS